MCAPAGSQRGTIGVASAPLLSVDPWMIPPPRVQPRQRSPPAFVRAPEGNGCAERFIRTLKEQLLRVRNFHTVEDLRLTLLARLKTATNTG
jgi:hypothetical protein